MTKQTLLEEKQEAIRVASEAITSRMGSVGFRRPVMGSAHKTFPSGWSCLYGIVEFAYLSAKFAHGVTLGPLRRADFPMVMAYLWIDYVFGHVNLIRLAVYHEKLKIAI